MKISKLLLLLVTASAFSQNVELKWAEKIKTSGSDYVSVLGESDGNYYTAYRNKDKHLVCRLYDNKLNLKDEREVSFNMETDKYTYDNAYFLKDKIVHFTREHIRKEDKNYLYATVTDLKLKTGEKTYVLDEADEDDPEFGSKTISPDSTKIAVYHMVKGKKKEPSVLKFKVYDSSLTDVLIDKTVQLEVKSRSFTTESVNVDNFGNIYILAKIDKERDEREKKQSRFYYKLLVFNKEELPKEFDIDYPERDIESIDIISGENNTMICTGFLKTLDKGFLSARKKTLISDELFAVVIDCKGQTLKSSNKFELEGLYPDKLRGTEDYVPYKVRNIFYRKDGGVSVVAEQYKLVVQRYTSQYGTTTTYKYYYCDIAVIGIDNKLQVESISRMPKYQMNASNPSIIATHADGNTYIIYEDLEKNLAAENDKETKRSTKSWMSSDSKNALFLMTVLPNGEMKKEIIYSYKESKIRPKVLSSRVVNKNEIVLNADDQIGVLSISNKG